MLSRSLGILPAVSIFEPHDVVELGGRDFEDVAVLDRRHPMQRSSATQTQRKGAETAKNSWSMLATSRGVAGIEEKISAVFAALRWSLSILPVAELGGRDFEDVAGLDRRHPMQRSSATKTQRKGAETAKNSWSMLATSSGVAGIEEKISAVFAALR